MVKVLRHRCHRRHPQRGEVGEVFERGYWKRNDEKSKKVELLDASEGGDITEKTRRVPRPKGHSEERQ